LRYAVVAYLGARFGDQAAKILKANYGLISLILIGAVLFVYLLRFLRNKRKAAQ
jgi:hypothetical protein